MSGWDGVTSQPHRFGGREFLFGAAEVGHVHTNGVVDIPFPRSTSDALLADGLAAEHRWVPNSGWITFRIRSEEDLDHAVWLMRLSYLRYPLKAAPAHFAKPAPVGYYHPGKPRFQKSLLLGLDPPTFLLIRRYVKASRGKVSPQGVPLSE